uniref:DNA polymerase III delta N-terminal domain-containing protein n=1 Tax=viral metagenome TaxID=1070528 RepID=A0A6C0BQN6_9ZZZZ
MTSVKRLVKINQCIRDDNKRYNFIIYGPHQEDSYNIFMKYLSGYTSDEYTTKKMHFTMLSGYDISIKKGINHFELNMEFIPNIKIWNELYDHIRDIMIATNMKQSVILCNNFHCSVTDVIDTMYSLFDDTSHPDIHFVLLSRDITFISESIRDRFITIRSKKECIKKIHSSYDNMSDSITSFILNIDEITYHSIRNIVYDIFIHNLNPIDCILDVIGKLIYNKTFPITPDVLTNINYHINGMHKNYRSIYHLEAMMVYLVSNVHGLFNVDI